MTTFGEEIDRLRMHYPAFVIVPTRVYDGERVAAYCPDAAGRNGLYAVIGTPNEVETELARAVGGLEASLSTHPTPFTEARTRRDPWPGSSARKLKQMS